METGRRVVLTSATTLLPVLLASVFAAIAGVPDGYEAPYTFYFACCLVTLILSFYAFFLKKNCKNSILTSLTLVCVILFFGWNLKDRQLTRWVSIFPNDPVLIQICNILSAPVIVFQYILTYLNLTVPWSFGLAVSIFLLLVYWAYSARLLRRIGRSSLTETANAYPSDSQHRIRSAKTQRIGILLLALVAGSIRTLPTLTSSVPAGADTPFYAAALQGRLSPDFFGGFLRHVLYYLFRVIGVVLNLSFPTPLRSIGAVSIIPVVFHTIVVILTYNLVWSFFKDFKVSLLAGVFLATSIGMLRITWDLYKLLLSIPFALVSLQQLMRSIEARDRRRALLGLFFFTFAIACHATLGGIIFLALSSSVLIETLFKKGFFSESPWILGAILSIVILPWFLGDFLRVILFGGWYSGNLTSPLPNSPEVGVVSIIELFRWLGIAPLILAVLGILHLRRRRRGCGTFPSIWLLVSFLMIEQALFHSYTRVGQIHRVELLTSLPVSILASVGLVMSLGPLNRIQHRRRGISSTMIIVLVLTLSSLVVAWNYGGFLSWTMIREPEYFTMTWLLNFAPYTNCGVPTNFDSWTGYYGQIQNYELPTTFYIDRTATNNSPLYDLVYSGFNRIYVRTDLM